MAEFADHFITCSLKDPRTEKIVRAVNMHNHTKTCRKYNTKCRFLFPRYPSLRTIIAEPVKLISSSTEEQKKILKQCKDTLEKVKKVLEDDDQMEDICKTQESEIEAYMRNRKSIQKLEFYLEENRTANKNTKIKIKDTEVQQILLGVAYEEEVEVERMLIDKYHKILSNELDKRKIDCIIVV